MVSIDGQVIRRGARRDRSAHQRHQFALRGGISNETDPVVWEGTSGVLSLTTQHLVDRHGDLLTVADLISPDLREHVATTSTVRDQIDNINRQPS
ncbi:MAG: hypothetical protein JO075_12495 [Acidimicrobiia bacterium]|nr:hypothetical protein [Acidimicrobiia bacterium]